VSGSSARARLASWALDTEGSTRSSALLRIGLALLVFARYGSEFLLFRHPEPERLAFAMAFFFCTTAMACGLWSRVSTGATGVLLLTMFYYRGIHLGYDPWVSHHSYLLACATVLCALTPCGRSYSLDRWFALRRAERAGDSLPAERGNLWGLRLLALQVSLVYLYTAWDKTNLAFLSGDRLQHYAHWYYLGSDPPSWPGFAASAAIAACLTVALEYALAGGMLFVRTRRWLVVPGLLLHAAFYVLLPVRTFSATIVLLYLAYFDAGSVHRVIDRLQGVGTRTGGS
jgi:hypothetical protein